LRRNSRRDGGGVTRQAVQKRITGELKTKSSGATTYAPPATGHALTDSRVVSRVLAALPTTASELLGCVAPGRVGTAIGSCAWSAQQC
jgi:hypothetical protein